MLETPGKLASRKGLLRTAAVLGVGGLALAGALALAAEPPSDGRPGHAGAYDVLPPAWGAPPCFDGCPSPGEVAVTTHGDAVAGYVAVSATGDANGGYAAASGTGDAHGGYLGASGTGNATGGYAAASLAGCARGGYVSLNVLGCDGSLDGVGAEGLMVARPDASRGR